MKKPNRIGDRVFMALSSAYGRQFQAQFQNEEQMDAWRATWAGVLSDMSEDQLRFGIREASMTGSGFVPTLPEFRKMCEAYRRPGYQAPLPEFERGPLSAATQSKVDAVMQGLKSRGRGVWWTPERVENHAQVDYIVLQAQRFGLMSAAGRFLHDCIAAGRITADHKLGSGKPDPFGSAPTVDESPAPWDEQAEPVNW